MKPLSSGSSPNALGIFLDNPTEVNNGWEVYNQQEMVVRIDYNEAQPNLTGPLLIF
jgi:hypothetical protein